MRLRQKVALTVIVILGFVFFIFVPFVGASALGPAQLPCYFAGTCEPGYMHYTVSLSCLLQGPNGIIGANYYDVAGFGFGLGCGPLIA